MWDWVMDGWMDTPQTVMTTRAPAVLKIPSKLEVAPHALKMCEWVMDGWMDTPQTVTTTRAPTVLKMQHCKNDVREDAEAQSSFLCRPK